MRPSCGCAVLTAALSQRQCMVRCREGRDGSSPMAIVLRVEETTVLWVWLPDLCHPTDSFCLCCKAVARTNLCKCQDVYKQDLSSNALTTKSLTTSFMWTSDNIKHYGKKWPIWKWLSLWAVLVVSHRMLHERICESVKPYTSMICFSIHNGSNAYMFLQGIR